MAFGVVLVANTMLGIKSVERFAALAAPAVIAISIWTYFALEGIAETQGLNMWTFRAEGEMSLLVLLIANMSFWSTMAIDIPNLTQFIRTRPGAKSFVNLAPRLIGYRSGLALAGIVGTL